MSVEIFSKPIADLVKMARDTNAGILRLSLNDGDTPHICVYVINGVEACAQIDEAIAQVEKRWEEESE